MSVHYFAVTHHVGIIQDLIGQDVVIAVARALRTEWPETVEEIMAETAQGRAWCRVFPTGSQVPTRGGIMRVVAHHKLLGGPGADMLSADEMLVRVRAELENEREARVAAERERDHLRAEVQRWRERAAEDHAMRRIPIDLHAITGGLGW